MGLWNKTCSFGFFFEKLLQLYESARWVGHENRSRRSQDLSLGLKKNPEGPKIDRKSTNYFSACWPRDDSYGSKTGIKW